MAVYEPVSAERKAEMLLHLLMLSHSLHRKGLDSARAASGALSPDLITNIRRFDYTPSPRQIYAISQNLNLTIGGAFKLFGYNLESLRQLDFLLNSARTRLIETYPFYRDRLVDVPDILGDATAFNQNSFIADMVRSWRHGVPIRAIRGHHWRSQRLLYGQIGTNDQMAFRLFLLAQSSQSRKPPKVNVNIPTLTAFIFCNAEVDILAADVWWIEEDYFSSHMLRRSICHRILPTRTK